MNDSEFEVMVHLCGEQPVPNLLAVRHFPNVRRHLFVASSRTKDVARRVLDVAGVSGGVITVKDAWDAPSLVGRLQDLVTEGGAAAYNVTGGTKLMSIAALNHALETAGRAFYVHTAGDVIQWITDGWPREPLDGSLAIDDFVRLAGHDLLDCGYWQDRPEREARADATRRLWGFQKALTRTYGAVSKVLAGRSSGHPIERRAGGDSVKVDWSGGIASLVCMRGGRVLIEVSDQRLALLEYACGGWFEEFCFLKLRESMPENGFKDIRIGLRPSWNPSADDDRADTGIQEMDVALTDGLRLFIVECKAGNVSQEDIQKLENNVATYGGAMGKGILASCWPLGNRKREGPRERIQQSSHVAAFAASAVPERMPSELRTAEPGIIFSKA